MRWHSLAAYVPTCTVNMHLLPSSLFLYFTRSSWWETHLPHSSSRVVSFFPFSFFLLCSLSSRRLCLPAFECPLSTSSCTDVIHFSCSHYLCRALLYSEEGCIFTTWILDCEHAKCQMIQLEQWVTRSDRLTGAKCHHTPSRVGVVTHFLSFSLM